MSVCGEKSRRVQRSERLACSVFLLVSVWLLRHGSTGSSSFVSSATSPIAPSVVAGHRLLPRPTRRSTVLRHQAPVDKESTPHASLVALLEENFADKCEPFEVLELDFQADEELITRHFKKVVKATHPDVSKENNEHFIKAHRAYQILRNGDLRRELASECERRRLAGETAEAAFGDAPTPSIVEDSSLVLQWYDEESGLPYYYDVLSCTFSRSPPSDSAQLVLMEDEAQVLKRQKLRHRRKLRLRPLVQRKNVLRDRLGMRWGIANVSFIEGFIALDMQEMEDSCSLMLRLPCQLRGDARRTFWKAQVRAHPYGAVRLLQMSSSERQERFKTAEDLTDYLKEEQENAPPPTEEALRHWAALARRRAIYAARKRTRQEGSDLPTSSRDAP
mmetsp:Transcript_48821/g.116069  ORF Transcript_48821/g.116069 Transcript_48821/m.116069 type:complete len:390 (-) Transcript_48821:265-1434(-)